MEFEWDHDKSEANFAARGLGFDDAARIFDGVILEERDTRRDYGEARVKAVGETGGHILVVIYTDRANIRRIISARPASKKERIKWQSSVKP